MKTYLTTHHLSTPPLFSRRVTSADHVIASVDPTGAGSEMLWDKLNWQQSSQSSPTPPIKKIKKPQLMFSSLWSKPKPINNIQSDTTVKGTMTVPPGSESTISGHVEKLVVEDGATVVLQPGSTYDKLKNNGGKIIDRRS